MLGLPAMEIILHAERVLQEDVCGGVGLAGEEGAKGSACSGQRTLQPGEEGKGGGIALARARRPLYQQRGLAAVIRDVFLLPLVEGTSVATKYGMIKTDHILFIASGAFHFAKPSDLIPELQGRFPIRVELKTLNEGDFIRILKEPKSALVKQYTALLETEGIKLSFSEDALVEISRIAAQVNDSAENIGARRLHTIMEKLLEHISFEGPDLKKKNIRIDAVYVRKQLAEIVKDQDLSRYIL